MARTKREAPVIPETSEEEVRRGAPSARAGYLRDGLPTYRHKDGKNRIRFLAWSKKEKRHFLYYLWVHRNIGVERNAFACPSKNVYTKGQACPICEDIQRRLNAGEEWMSIKDQGIMLGKHPRILAQVIDRSNEEEGVQIWESTAFEVSDAITSLSIHEDTGEVIPWTNPERGRDLIYQFDPASEYRYPKQLTRSDPSKVSPDFYHDIMDFEEEVIYWATYEEIAEAYGASVAAGDELEPERGEVEYSRPDPAEAELEPCPDFGKEYDKYVDCDECVDAKECKVETERAKAPPEEAKPARRRRPKKA